MVISGSINGQTKKLAAEVKQATKLIGYHLAGDMTIVVRGSLNRQSQKLAAEVKQTTTLTGHVGRSAESSVPIYAGPYEVTPTPEAQHLATSGKLMKADVAVKEIPYFDVGNPSGGSTVYIGMIE